MRIHFQRCYSSGLLPHVDTLSELGFKFCIRFYMKNPGASLGVGKRAEFVPVCLDSTPKPPPSTGPFVCDVILFIFFTSGVLRLEP